MPSNQLSQKWLNTLSAEEKYILRAMVREEKRIANLASRIAAAKPAVLIIEDCPELAVLHGAILEHYLGISCAIVSSAEEAAAVLAIYPPKIIVSEAWPPLVRLCRALKRDPQTASVPIFILTCRDVDDVEQGIREAGADAYLRKGGDDSPAVLVAEVQRLLQRYPEFHNLEPKHPV